MMSAEVELKHRDQYLSALRFAVQSQWQEAVAAIRPLADEGDAVATVLTAQYLMNAGNYAEGIPYAQKAARAGNGFIAQNYFGNLWGQPDHKVEAIAFLQLAMEAGYPGGNPIEYAPSAIQEGREDLAIQLLRLGIGPQPAPARAAWEDLLDRAQQDESRIKSAAEEVDSHRATALEEIQKSEESLEENRDRAKRLVEETDQLVHEASAATLAREYGRHAQAEEERADRFTRAAILAGLVAAIGTAVIAYLAFSNESGVGAVLTKGALTIPLILFAGYVARLAGQFRRKAWGWRHVELQIQTSEPFIALLDDGPRKALLAALALRFFPGQSQAPDGDAVADLGDPAAILNSLGFSPQQVSKKEPDPPPEQPAVA
jgi:hypothetical protein